MTYSKKLVFDINRFCYISRGNQFKQVDSFNKQWHMVGYRHKKINQINTAIIHSVHMF